MAVFKRGNIYWFEFVFDGRRIQQSTKQGNRKAAIDIESAYRTALAKGEVGIASPKKKQRTIGELLDAVEAHYNRDGKMSSQNRSLIDRARRDFGSTLARDLTPEDIVKYVQGRIGKGAKNATVNRVTQILRRAYTLANLPAPKMFAPSEKGNVRKGFFSAGKMQLVLAHLPDDGLRDFVRFGYITGMRKGEIESLRWDNLEDGVLKLAAEDAKTGEARTVPCDSGELGEIIKRRLAARSIKTADGTIAISKYIFHRGDGEAVGEFRKSWKTACVAASVGRWVKRGKRRLYEGRIFHDCRRSSVRDMIRAGVPQTVAHVDQRT